MDLKAEQLGGLANIARWWSSTVGSKKSKYKNARRKTGLLG
jgi:hypothetical protein